MLAASSRALREMNLVDEVQAVGIDYFVSGAKAPLCVCRTKYLKLRMYSLRDDVRPKPAWVRLVMSFSILRPNRHPLDALKLEFEIAQASSDVMRLRRRSSTHARSNFNRVRVSARFSDSVPS